MEINENSERIRYKFVDFKGKKIYLLKLELIYLLHQMNNGIQ